MGKSDIPLSHALIPHGVGLKSLDRGGNYKKFLGNDQSFRQMKYWIVFIGDSDVSEKRGQCCERKLERRVALK